VSFCGFKTARASEHSRNTGPAGRRRGYLRACRLTILDHRLEVYVNKLGIRDKKLLEETERSLTEQRSDEGFPPRAHHKTYAGFKAIHRHLFQDLYRWAGKERNYTTGRSSVPFARPQHITTWMEGLFRQLVRDDYLVGRNKRDFATEAARYVNEINACHPFIDGNGRTQRFWLRMLAENAGFALTLAAADIKRWNNASRLGFVRSDHAPMARLIQSRLRMSSRNRPKPSAS
jgi:cell filamentation protein